MSKSIKKHWPEVPIIEDIRDVTREAYQETIANSSRGRSESNRQWYAKETENHQPITLITGGFPCQPFSVAGKRKGKEDDRYLWPAMLDVIKAFKPTWVVGENVFGIIGMALDTVLSNLEHEGYETQAFVIPACGVNAPHRRYRVFIVGYSAEQGLERDARQSVQRGSLRLAGTDKDIADTESRKSRKQEARNRGKVLAEEVKKMLPTPKGRVWKGQTQRGIHAPGDGLPNMDNGQGKVIGGQLNPNWVEWLMGFPPGWTDLNV